MKSTLLFCLAVVLAAAAFSHDASAQASLTFTGGLGAPLTLKLNAPVTYTVTTASNSGPIFNFQNVVPVDSNASSTFAPANGSMTYTINGGTTQNFYQLFLTPRDGLAFFFGTVSGVRLAVGDSVTLNPGMLTTLTSVAAAPPISGSFPTFISDGNNNPISAVNGATPAVPEPSTWALVGLGVVGVGAVLNSRLVPKDRRCGGMFAFWRLR